MKRRLGPFGSGKIRETERGAVGGPAKAGRVTLPAKGSDCTLKIGPLDGNTGKTEA